MTLILKIRENTEYIFSGEHSLHLYMYKEHENYLHVFEATIYNRR
jgi:hypothetical protein